MSADVLSDETTGPRSIGDRAEDGDSGVPEEELFPHGTLAGDGVTPQNIVRKGMPATLKVALTKQSIDLVGAGMKDPNKYGRALVTYLPAPIHETPVREDKADPAKVTGWKIIQDLRVIRAVDAVPADLVRTEFEVMLVEDAKAAAALLDELQAMAAAALG